MSDKKYVGTVIWFNKQGYGFLKWENEQDMFVHFSDLIDQSGFKTLKKGQTVEFRIGKNLQGRDKAIEVKII